MKKKNISLSMSFFTVSFSRFTPSQLNCGIQNVIVKAKVLPSDILGTDGVWSEMIS